MSLKILLVNYVLGKGILVVYAASLLGLSGRDLVEMFCTKYPVVLSRLLHSMVIFVVIMIITLLC